MGGGALDGAFGGGRVKRNGREVDDGVGKARGAVFRAYGLGWRVL